MSKNVLYLSNQELVEEFSTIRNPTWSSQELERREVLKKEILRRLNEVWRK